MAIRSRQPMRTGGGSSMTYTNGGKVRDTVVRKKDEKPETAIKNNSTNKVSTVTIPSVSTTTGGNAPVKNQSNAVTPTSTIKSNTTTSQKTTENVTSNSTPITPTISQPHQYSEAVQSQAVIDAKNYLNSILAKKPGTFSSDYETQMNDIMASILGRDKFSYDLNTDMLYQQAKDQYTALGNMAMQDTMGQAASLTGGYGNSYANTAGYQAYQGYLQNLNNNIPEYYQMALDKYTREGEELLNQYSLARDLYDNDYNQYRDSMNDWYNDYSNAYSQYINTQNLDYDSYTAAQNLAYQKERDAVSDAQWQKQYDTSVSQWEKEYNTALEQWQKEYELSQTANNAAGGASYSELDNNDYKMLETLSVAGENETIERWLTNWMASGKISETEAQRLMDEYYSDSGILGNGLYDGNGLPKWKSLILNPDGSLK